MFNTFSCTCWLSVFFGKISIQVFCLFKLCWMVIIIFLILSCISSLCILDINPLSIISFANIFSHLVDCVFILSVVPFAVQKLSSLIRSYLLVFAFISFAVGFPGGSDGKDSSCNAGNLGLIPESGRSPGEGNGHPLQYSCLGNPQTISVVTRRQDPKNIATIYVKECLFCLGFLLGVLSLPALHLSF